MPLKRTLVAILLIAIFQLIVLPAYSHEWERPHIHLSGTVTTPEGEPVDHASLRNYADPQVWLTNLPEDPGQIGRVGAFRSWPDGNWQFLIYFFEPEKIIDHFDAIGVNPAAMDWALDDHVIRPKDM
ncbi:MAG: hypothetical protein GY858_09375 [Candidatus Omnitrophica bacterium]|nr:hypothetical protein [Candidatus Omnitrophota bacterium]